MSVMYSQLQSLMERALAGQFDRSLKFGHSGGIWQVNDKGWEDDHDHIDFDVSPSLCIPLTCASSASCSAAHDGDTASSAST